MKKKLLVIYLANKNGGEQDNMTAYIIDTKNFKIEKTYKDSSYASYAMSDNYGWEPGNRYKMIHDENALYDYWFEHEESTGIFYEGLGISEDMKHSMFKDWVDEK